MPKLTKAEERRVNRVLNRWEKIARKWAAKLWVSDHDIKFIYEHDKVKSEANGWTALASVTIKPQYLEVEVTTNLHELLDTDPKKFDRHLVHEMLHVALAPLQEWRNKLLDFLQERLDKDIIPEVSDRTWLWGILGGFEDFWGYANEYTTTRLTDTVLSLSGLPVVPGAKSVVRCHKDGCDKSCLQVTKKKKPRKKPS